MKRRRSWERTEGRLRRAGRYRVDTEVDGLALEALLSLPLLRIGHRCG